MSLLAFTVIQEGMITLATIGVVAAITFNIMGRAQKRKDSSR